MGLHVLGQLLDLRPGQDGDLNLGVAGVDGVLPNWAVSSALRSLEQSLFHLSFLVARGRRYSPRTGKPPVERATKVEVPTVGYVTTSSPRWRIITDPT